MESFESTTTTERVTVTTPTDGSSSPHPFGSDLFLYIAAICCFVALFSMIICTFFYCRKRKPKPKRSAPNSFVDDALVLQTVKSLSLEEAIQNSAQFQLKKGSIELEESHTNPAVAKPPLLPPPMPPPLASKKGSPKRSPKHSPKPRASPKAIANEIKAKANARKSEALAVARGKHEPAQISVELWTHLMGDDTPQHPDAELTSSSSDYDADAEEVGGVLYDRSAVVHSAPAAPKKPSVVKLKAIDSSEDKPKREMSAKLWTHLMGDDTPQHPDAELTSSSSEDYDSQDVDELYGRSGVVHSKAAAPKKVSVVKAIAKAKKSEALAVDRPKHEASQMSAELWTHLMGDDTPQHPDAELTSSSSSSECDSEEDEKEVELVAVKPRAVASAGKSGMPVPTGGWFAGEDMRKMDAIASSFHDREVVDALADTQPQDVDDVLDRQIIAMDTLSGSQRGEQIQDGEEEEDEAEEVVIVSSKPTAPLNWAWSSGVSAVDTSGAAHAQYAHAHAREQKQKEQEQDSEKLMDYSSDDAMEAPALAPVRAMAAVMMASVSATDDISGVSVLSLDSAMSHGSDEQMGMRVDSEVTDVHVLAVDALERQALAIATAASSKGKGEDEGECAAVDSLADVVSRQKRFARSAEEKHRALLLELAVEKDWVKMEEEWAALNDMGLDNDRLIKFIVDRAKTLALASGYAPAKSSAL